MYEVNFRPIKRLVRGQHQPDIAYQVSADTPSAATTKARMMIVHEHPGYLHTSTREIA